MLLQQKNSFYFLLPSNISISRTDWQYFIASAHRLQFSGRHVMPVYRGKFQYRVAYVIYRKLMYHTVDKQQMAPLRAKNKASNSIGTFSQSLTIMVARSNDKKYV